MAKVQELAQLKDIHLPEPIGLWPLAMGWYALAVLLLVLVVALIMVLRRLHVQARPKRQALCLLQQYEQDHKSGKNDALICARVSELLKRVALAYFPRQQVAGLKGTQWVAFLNRTAKNVDFHQIEVVLVDMPYFVGESNHDLSLLFQMSREWIRQRRKRCSN